MALIAVIAIPADIRALIQENCKNSKGRYRMRYAWRELKSLAGLYAQILFVASMLAFTVGFGLIVLDRYVKLEIIGSAFAQADWSWGQWEENLRSGPNNVEKEFTQQHVAQGGTKDSAVMIMKFLWKAVPVLMLVCFAMLMLSVRLTSKVFNNALQLLVKTEVERNRRRTQRRYLRSTSHSSA
ncbi:hypothetical protein K239x_38180 [Planctomycetes bacterium K23_9]|uniref:Uncharacterized protein n=2 Tax=Stieleria marina TaxID=1930275 RepID=A0A517NXI0_9BACT|nr:hypothetical protein K239x_38180 [Planctomycetes bacterium K23_9]